MRVFTIISGFEIADIQRHFVASGYSSLETLLADIDTARELVLKSIQANRKDEKLDMDSFLDALNQERKNNQGNI